MVTWEEIDRAIDEVVMQCLELADLSQPPVDPVHVVDALEMHAQVDAKLPGRGERRTVNGRSVILIRPEERPEREQFALAHEIGEEVAVELLIDRLELAEASDHWREAIANRFAGRLLCPSAWLRDAMRAVGDDLLELKRTFSTASHEVIARQMLSLDVPTVVTVIDNGVMQSRMGNVPHETCLTPVEDEAWRRCHRAVLTIDESWGSLRVQAWAIHEDGWQREVLRTTRLDL